HLTAAKNAVFLLRAAQLPHEDLWLLDAAAQVVLDARRGWSAARPQKQSTPPRRGLSSERPPTVSGRMVEPSATRLTASTTTGETLEFWNGNGGFAADGREYHIPRKAGVNSPAPWSNVVANPRFGTLITESGGGYTWADNSRQNKLTSWSNDPVTDP